jgi:hypothetical protein
MHVIAIMQKDADMSFYLSKFGSFNESEYFHFLGQKVPQDLTEQLRIDCGPDLAFDSVVTMSDLVAPLSSFAFPESREKSVHLTSVLEHAVYGYSLQRAKGHDPYKQIYIASLLIYVALHRKDLVYCYECAMQVLTTAAQSVEWETRFHVARFLVFLILLIEQVNSVSPAPISTASICLQVVVGSVFIDIVRMTQKAMQTEDFKHIWPEKKNEDAIANPRDITYLLKNVLSLSEDLKFQEGVGKECFEVLEAIREE